MSRASPCCRRRPPVGPVPAGRPVAGDGPAGPRRFTRRERRCPARPGRQDPLPCGKPADDPKNRRTPAPTPTPSASPPSTCEGGAVHHRGGHRREAEDGERGIAERAGHVRHRHQHDGPRCPAAATGRTSCRRATAPRSTPASVRRPRRVTRAPIPTGSTGASSRPRTGTPPAGDGGHQDQHHEGADEAAGPDRVEPAQEAVEGVDDVLLRGRRLVGHQGRHQHADGGHAQQHHVVHPPAAQLVPAERTATTAP